MEDTEDQLDEPPKKKSKLPLIVGLVLALAGGGGGFYAVSSGLILGGGSTEDHAHEQEDREVKDMPDVAFVPIEPLVISVGGKDVSHLRFRAQLEVRSAYREEVEKLMPRVVDVLNSYLRAVAVEDLSNNSALVRLRAQMLRRVQVVTGGDRVNDLLIMEFVLN
ncbi:flagellar basal body protein FliL [Roseovarius atlanticus]|uniref:Flagellar protein FliL n=1 Tax=Roseovarius atlanticus TaxID=1641875 RepID=A0A0T5NRF7_9RHOB|nr:flagellar basal body-associated FliL family protein [Roseovarius atlanticus]KRS11302.1 flagellar basal body protein FliL [Roseovarius atlanticus]